MLRNLEENLKTHLSSTTYCQDNQNHRLPPTFGGMARKLSGSTSSVGAREQHTVDLLTARKALWLFSGSV